jgi:hypothetical protein
MAGVYHHWSIDVIGPNAYVSYDGKGYGQMNLGGGNEILERYSKPHMIEKKKSPRAASNASA